MQPLSLKPDRGRMQPAYLSCLLALSLCGFGVTPMVCNAAQQPDASVSLENSEKNIDNVVNAAVLNSAGTILASVDGKNISMFEVASGKTIQTIKGGGYRIAFSPDGKLLAVGASNNQIRILDVVSGKELITLPGSSGPKGDFFVIKFSSDGQKLISTDHSQLLTLWDLSNGQKLFTTKEKNGDILSADFSSDSKIIGGFASFVASRTRGTVTLWDTTSGAVVHSMPAYLTFAASPCDQRFATSKGNVTKVVEGTSNRLVKILDTDLCTLSPDGRTLIGGGFTNHDKNTRIFDAQSGTEMHKLDGGNFRAVCSADGKRVVTTSLKATWVWDVATGKKLATFNRPVTLVTALDADGKFCAAVSQSLDDNDTATTIDLYDVTTGKMLRKMTGTGPSLFFLSFSPDGKQLVTASAQKTGQEKSTKKSDLIQIWDVASGTELKKWTVSSHPLTVTYSPDGKVIVTAFKDDSLKVYDVMTGREICTMHLDETHSVGFSPVIAFSPDNKFVYGANEVSIKCWNLFDGRELSSIPLDIIPNSIVVDSTGNVQVCGAADHIQIFDGTGKEIQSIYTPQYSFFDLAFGKDGKTLYGMGSLIDQNLRVWDVATGKKVQEYALPTSDNKIGATIRAKFNDDFKWMLMLRGSYIDIYDVNGLKLLKTVSLSENQIGGSIKPVTAQ